MHRCLRYLSLACPSLMVLPLLACPGPVPFTPPAPDSCAAPESGAISGVEIGPGDFDDDKPFVAWQDGDVLHPVIGGQGLQMFGVRIRVQGGGALPKCLPQVTRLETLQGAEITKLSTALKTYAGQDGTRTTRTLWVPEYPPDWFVLEVQAGGQKVRRLLQVAGAVGTPDGWGDGVGLAADATAN